MNTIFALSTVFGKSGIAVFRISGNSAYDIIKILKINKDIVPRKAIFTNFYDDEGEIIDEGIIIYFPAPASFTGEDVIELNLHGSIAVINAMLIHLSKYFKMADKGEFTKRAFINGKFDLTAAEGIADLINAETILQRKQALKQISGISKELYENWRREVISVMAIIEAFIDFPDEDISNELMQDIKGKMQNLILGITSYLDDGKRGQKIRDGIKITIIGPPNAGKSTLFNYLAKKNAAIVSSRPGTTRDVIEIFLDIEGFLVVIQDTAGIHEATDEIEQEGIKRTNSTIEMADLILLMTPICDINSLLLEINAFKNKVPTHAEIIYVISKYEEDVKTQTDSIFQIKQSLGEGVIEISVHNKAGLSTLNDKILDFLKSHNVNSESPIITEERHRRELIKSLEAMQSFLRFEDSLEILAEHLRVASECIGSITGTIHVEEILDELFSKLCIGK